MDMVLNLTTTCLPWQKEAVCLTLEMTNHNQWFRRDWKLLCQKF